MISKLLWKTVHTTDAYHYQEHRLLKRRRAIKHPGSTAKRPLHSDWLNGGEFKRPGRKAKGGA